MNSFPWSVRVATGLAVSAAEHARELPKQLVGLPITVISRAMHLTMHVQQRVTELAIKGDDWLGSWSSTEDTPSWATFDEDEPASAARDRKRSTSREWPSGANSNGHPSSQRTPETYVSGPTAAPRKTEAAGPTTREVPPEQSRNPRQQRERRHVQQEQHQQEQGQREQGQQEQHQREQGATEAGRSARASETGHAQPPRGTDALVRATTEDVEDPWEAEERAMARGGNAFADAAPSTVVPSEAAPSEAGPAEAAPSEAGPEAPAESITTPEAAAGTAGAGAARGPEWLPGYPDLTLPQVRARLRTFSVAQLEELLNYERAHENRSSFVGMLSRRIANVRRQTGQTQTGQAQTGQTQTGQAQTGQTQPAHISGSTRSAHRGRS